jgi:hypothetical protein
VVPSRSRELKPGGSSPAGRLVSASSPRSIRKRESS